MLGFFMITTLTMYISEKIKQRIKNNPRVTTPEGLN